jgi:hypothetical protein
MRRIRPPANPGAISENSSSHLPPSEASRPANPVMFSPGRSSRATMPLATGSLRFAKTILSLPAETAALCPLAWHEGCGGCHYNAYHAHSEPRNSGATHVLLTFGRHRREVARGVKTSLPYAQQCREKAGSSVPAALTRTRRVTLSAVVLAKSEWRTLTSVQPMTGRRLRLCRL